jgi:hypothetical protein
MLPRQEKKRIREEEIFRIEVQRELASRSSQKSLTSGLWKFVNSAFVLWLLSSIFLSIVSWGFARWYAKLELDRQREETVKRLDIEIASRFESVDFLRWGYRLIDDKQIPDLPTQLLFPPGDQAALDPVYSHRNLKSLLYELSLNVPENEREPIRGAIQNVERIEGRWAGRKMPAGDLSDFQEIVKETYKIRWDPFTNLQKRAEEIFREVDELKEPWYHW